jgi:hypothetical protein
MAKRIKKVASEPIVDSPIAKINEGGESLPLDKAIVFEVDRLYEVLVISDGKYLKKGQIHKIGGELAQNLLAKGLVTIKAKL